MQKLKKHFLSLAFILSSTLLLAAPYCALAADKAERIPTKTGTQSFSKFLKASTLFKRGTNPRGSFFDVEDLDQKDEFIAPEPKRKTREEILEEQVIRVDSERDAIPSPEEKTTVRINKNAPGEAKGMIGAMRIGNEELASQYATALVRKQKQFFFEVREITRLYGAALLKESPESKKDWIGAEQTLAMEMARTRNDFRALVRPDHNAAMRRIKPDSKGKAQVLYFFSLSCSWCRQMAPDIERIWRVAQKDKNISMAALTIGKAPKTWVDEYRNYTGLSVPIYDGEELAKQFNIKFVPTIVIIAPSNRKAYRKSGQQSFARLYQFVRKVQGIPAQLSPTIKELIKTPIGEREIILARKSGIQIASQARGQMKTNKRRRVQVERF